MGKSRIAPCEIANSSRPRVLELLGGLEVISHSENQGFPHVKSCPALIHECWRCWAGGSEVISQGETKASRM